MREGTPPEVCARRDSQRVADTCGNHHGRALPLHHALNGSSNLRCVTTATDSKTPGSNCVARRVLWASVLWCTRTCFLGHLRVSSMFLLSSSAEEANQTGHAAHAGRGGCASKSNCNDHSTNPKGMFHQASLLRRLQCHATTLVWCCNHRRSATRGASSAASQPCLSVYCLLRL